MDLSTIKEAIPPAGRGGPRRRWMLAVTAALCLALVGQPAVARADDVPAQMAKAADRFLKSLDEPRRAKAFFAFDSSKRTVWHYFPSSMLVAKGGRPGLPIKEMSPKHKALAHALLSTALSHEGYLQAMTIMMLEAILRDMEHGNPRRDPEMYHVSIHGTPSTKATWGWSFEGHHLSVNVTLVDGQRLCVTPSFFGSNPAIVKSGPHKGLETLAAEQQLARALVVSLTPEQKKLAVIAVKAPRDIITGAARAVAEKQFQPAKGIPLEKLDAKQKKMLLDLVRHFAAKYRTQITEEISKRTPIVDTRGMHFAWAGGFEPGQGHYYRIQTAHFLFEYDNTQDGANHIHTVWRQFDGDFGADLLRQHYDTSPHHKH